MAKQETLLGTSQPPETSQRDINVSRGRDGNVRVLVGNKTLITPSVINSGPNAGDVRIVIKTGGGQRLGAIQIRPATPEFSLRIETRPRGKKKLDPWRPIVTLTKALELFQEAQKNGFEGYPNVRDFTRRPPWSYQTRRAWERWVHPDEKKQAYLQRQKAKAMAAGLPILESKPWDLSTQKLLYILGILESVRAEHPGHFDLPNG